MSSKFPNIPNDDLPGIPSLSATVPFWDDSPVNLVPSNAHLSPWDICLLDGLQLPGLCQVQSKRRRRLDVKKTKGSPGATITFCGTDPADVMITCRIWTQTHLDVYQFVVGLLSPTAKDAKFTAIDIDHPSLTLLGIHSVVIQHVDGLQPSSVKGVWETKISCIEYIPPSKKNVTKTATGSANDGTVAHAVQANRLQKPPQPSATDTGPG